MSASSRERSSKQVSAAGRLLSTARQRRHLSQRVLARAAGVPQSTVATIESGNRDPSVAMLERLLDAAGFALEPRLTNTVRPSRLLEQYTDDISRALARYPVAQVWAFGSVARGEDTAASDLDLLVELFEGSSVVDIFGLDDELSDILACPVDVVTTTELQSNDLLRHKVHRHCRELSVLT